VTIKEIYWTIGAYDLAAILEAADDETVAAGMLRLVAQGTLQAQTLRAFTADEARVVIAKSR
jgi:uncharacterized protein with GYD domain